MKNISTTNESTVTTETTPVRFSFLAMVISLVLTGAMLCLLLTHSGSSAAAAQTNAGIMDKFDRFVTNNIMVEFSDHVGEEVERTYWLSDSDMVAPEPNQAAFGEATDPATLQWLLDDAAKLLNGQDTLFTTETIIKDGSTIHYYLDETIFAITWKQVVSNCVYTFSEVKIAHPSQFRRFLSEGQYGSGVLHTASEMSASVNAVVASAGDYYSYRRGGVVVTNGTLHRSTGCAFLDTCFINDEGDLLFATRGELKDEAAVEQYIQDNNVRFTLCFGPLMLLDGEYKVPHTYSLGEPNDFYPRAALCQMDKLHYVLIAANTEKPNYGMPSVSQFARRLQEMGIPTAYTLDGGQTATIVMNDETINTISYGSEREISDIVYFATALPSNNRE